MSSFAFGTQKISDENLLHIEALKEAIESGLRLIETSPGYTNGGAQRAIARAMAFFEDDIREEIEIVTSAEYLPEHELDIAAFIEKALEESSKNLQLPKLQTFLIGCREAEYYEAFVALEKAVNIGEITAYGICGNAVADIKKLLESAKKAALVAGNDKHSFSTIELPLNLLEQEGLQTAALAKKEGLRVLACRPLDAQKEGLMYRLAEYAEPKEYFHFLNELLEICDNEQLKALYNLIEQMDMNRHKFGWIGEYDRFLVAQILPHIKKTVENIHETLLDTLLEYIERFLREYREMVAYESSLMTKTAFKDELQGCEKKMQECAFGFLLENDDIDYIVVSMRKPSYVQEIMALKS